MRSADRRGYPIGGRVRPRSSGDRRSVARPAPGDPGGHHRDGSGDRREPAWTVSSVCSLGPKKPSAKTTPPRLCLVRTDHRHPPRKAAPRLVDPCISASSPPLTPTGTCPSLLVNQRVPRKNQRNPELNPKSPTSETAPTFNKSTDTQARRGKRPDRGLPKWECPVVRRRRPRLWTTVTNRCPACRRSPALTPRTHHWRSNKDCRTWQTVNQESFRNIRCRVARRWSVSTVCPTLNIATRHAEREAH